MQTYMTWLYEKNVAGWPVHMLYAIEVACLVLTVLFLVLARYARNNRGASEFSAVVAGVCAGIATTWPVLLAPLFFPVRGETMLATVPFTFFAAPLAIWFWAFVFMRGLPWSQPAMSKPKGSIREQLLKARADIQQRIEALQSSPVSSNRGGVLESDIIIEGLAEKLREIDIALASLKSDEHRKLTPTT